MDLLLIHYSVKSCIDYLENDSWIYAVPPNVGTFHYITYYVYKSTFVNITLSTLENTLSTGRLSWQRGYPPTWRVASRGGICEPAPQERSLGWRYRSGDSQLKVGN